MKEKFECNDCHEKFEREIAAENVACCSDVICPQCSSVNVDNVTSKNELLAYLKSMCGFPGGG